MVAHAPYDVVQEADLAGFPLMSEDELMGMGTELPAENNVD